jgi:hypothetical protein
MRQEPLPVAAYLNRLREFASSDEPFERSQIYADDFSRHVSWENSSKGLVDLRVHKKPPTFGRLSAGVVERLRFEMRLVAANNSLWINYPRAYSRLRMRFAHRPFAGVFGS